MYFILFGSSINNPKLVDWLLILAIFGLAIPIIGSALLIAVGKGLEMKVYWTGLERYSGLYVGIHTLAHSSFLVFPLFLLSIESDSIALSKNRKILVALYLFLMFFGAYCMLKSYTRTTWIGTFILINFYLFKKRKFSLLSIFYIDIFVFALTSIDLKKAFFDILEPLSTEKDIRTIGSSRFGIWMDSLNIIKENGFTRFILVIEFAKHDNLTSYNKI